MSAYQVPDAHINAIVTWANAHRDTHGDLADPELFGQILKTANVLSVVHRYGSGAADMIDETPFVWRPHHGPQLTPVQVLKAINCLDYQCCEPDDWSTSRAAKMLDALRYMAIASLPGYGEAQWTIDALDAPAAPAPEPPAPAEDGGTVAF